MLQNCNNSHGYGGFKRCKKITFIDILRFVFGFYRGKKDGFSGGNNEKIRRISGLKNENLHNMYKIELIERTEIISVEVAFWFICETKRDF